MLKNWKEAMKILVINGPNLNLLGEREREIYGEVSLEEIESEMKKEAGEKAELIFFQSNHEGEIINMLHSKRKEVDGVIINPGALSHYSLALHDAIKSLKIPVLEVHLSNVFERGRTELVTTPASRGMISGLGKESYLLALRYFLSAPSTL